MSTHSLVTAVTNVTSTGNMRTPQFSWPDPKRA
jgi:hypothetical protein